MDYFYTIVTEVTAQKVDTARLSQDIKTAGLPDYQGCKVNLEKVDDDLCVIFANPLSGADKTKLDDIVKTHSGNPLERFDPLALPCCSSAAVMPAGYPPSLVLRESDKKVCYSNGTTWKAIP